MKHNFTVTNFSSSKAAAAEQLFYENEEILQKYIDKLIWWNTKINLTSRNVSRETVVNHVKHSILISQADSFLQAQKIIDTGTGGGLPGIPLAVLYSEKHFTLNDVVGKKVMVCKNIIRDLGLVNVKTASSSIENVEISNDSLIVSKHAFKINELYNLIRKKPWKNLLFLKGSKEVEAEMEGIHEKLNVTVFNFEEALNMDFYEGKALVEIKRNGIK